MAEGILIGLLLGIVGGYFLGRHVERRRKAGMTPEQIMSEAKAWAEQVASKVQK